MICHAVRMILNFQWSPKQATRIFAAVCLPSSLSVLRCRGKSAKMESTDAALLVKTLAQIPPAVVCFMSIQKKIFVPFPEPFVELKNGTIHTKYALPSRNHFKDSLCVAGRKTRNALTSEADLYLAGITQLVTVLLVDSIHQHKYIRSLKPLISA